MAYISSVDFEAQIKDEVLAMVEDGSGTALAQAIQQAEEQVRGCLSNRYDMAHELGQTGTNRNNLLIMLCIDVSLYHLHARVNGHAIPETRKERYKEAMSYLRDVAKGVYSMELKVLKDEDDATTSGSIIESKTKFTSDGW